MQKTKLNMLSEYLVREIDKVNEAKKDSNTFGINFGEIERLSKAIRLLALREQLEELEQKIKEGSATLEDIQKEMQEYMKVRKEARTNDRPRIAVVRPDPSWASAS